MACRITVYYFSNTNKFERGQSQNSSVIQLFTFFDVNWNRSFNGIKRSPAMFELSPVLPFIVCNMAYRANLKPLK